MPTNFIQLNCSNEEDESEGELSQSAANLEESDALSSEDSSSESSSSSSEDEISDDEDVADAKGHKKSRKKKTAGLFDALASRTAVNSLAADLLRHFKRNSEQAQRDMINMLFRFSGLVSVQVTKNDSVTETSEFVTNLKEEGEYLEGLKEDIRASGSYPASGKSKDDKRIVKRCQQFWEKVVDVCCSGPKPNICQEESLVDYAIQWMSLLGNAKAYPFRHAAACVAMALATSLVSRSKEIDLQLSQVNLKVQGELARSKSKGSAKNEKKTVRTANTSTLRAASALKSKLDSINENIQLIWTSVFRGRYRDTNASIRKLCIKSLNGWVRIYPEKFVSTEHLRHIGWLLSDPAKDVRKEAFAATKTVYQFADDTLPQVGKNSRKGFLGKFLPRIFEAVDDIEASITVKALDLLTYLYDQGFLEHFGGDEDNFLTEERVNYVFSKVFDASSRAVRVAAAKFTTKQYNQFDSLQQATALKKVQVQKNRVEESGASQGNNGSDQGNNDDVKIEDSADAVDEMNFETQDAQAMEHHEGQMGILLNVLDQVGGDPSYAAHIVDAFWGLPRVVCLTDLGRQIMSLLSDQSENTDDSEEQDITAQLYILRECIRRTCGVGEFSSDEANIVNTGPDPNRIGESSSPSSGSLSYKSKKNTHQTLSEEASAVLLRSLPALLRRYKDSSERIEILGELPKYLSLSTVGALKNAALFKDLLEVLRNCIMTFGSNRIKGEAYDAKLSTNKMVNKHEDINDSDSDIDPDTKDKKELGEKGFSALVRKLNDVTNTGGSNTVNILVQSIHHLLCPDSASSKRESKAQTKKLVSELSNSFQSAALRAKRANTNGSNAPKRQRDLDDEDPKFSACLHIFRLWEISRFIELDFFPNDLSDHVHKFCSGHLNDIASMTHIDSVAVSYSIRLLFQMGAWTFATVAEAARNKQNSEPNNDSMSLSRNENIISSPSMAVEEDENENENADEGSPHKSSDDMPPEARDALEERNRLISYIEFVLVSFAKATKGTRVGGLSGRKRASSDSFDSGIDSDESDDEDAPNESQNWLVSPSKAVTALRPIISTAFVSYADIMVMYTDRFHSENLALRDFSWYPPPSMRSALRHNFEILVKYIKSLFTNRANEGPLSEYALSSTEMQEAFEVGIVEELVNPLCMSFLYSSRHRSQPDLKLAATALRQCVQTSHKGAFADCSKWFCDQIKLWGRTRTVTTAAEQSRGFKMLLDIQKLSLRIQHYELTRQLPKLSEAQMSENLEAFADRQSKLLGTFASNKVVDERQTLIVAFLADAVLHGISGQDESVFLSTVKPYLAHLRPAALDQLLTILTEKTSGMVSENRMFQTSHFVDLKNTLEKRVKHSVKLGSSRSPASVSNVSAGLENDDIEEMSSESNSPQNVNKAKPSLSRDQSDQSSSQKRSPTSPSSGDEDGSQPMSAQSLNVSAISSAMSEDSEDSDDSDDSDDSKDSNSLSESRASGLKESNKLSKKGKKRPRSLSSRFSSVKKVRKSTLEEVKEVDSDEEEDSPAAHDASRANMGSDFTSSGVDSNPSSPVVKNRERLSSASENSSRLSAKQDNSVPPKKISKPRRRSNY